MVKNFKLIVLLLNFFFFYNSLFSHNFTAEIIDKVPSIEKTLYLCYGSPDHLYNCYKAQNFPYLLNYSGSKIEFLDNFKNFRIELSYYLPNRVAEFKYQVINEDTIKISTNGLYFYALIYVPKDDLYSFYYNGELASFYETSDYYVVSLISDGVLEIKKLTSSLSGKIFEARFNKYDYSKICFVEENLCCNVNDFEGCEGVYVPMLESLKINKNNNSFFFFGVKKLGQIINVSYFNLTNSLADKYLYEIKSNYNLKEFNLLWRNFLGDLVNIYIDNKKFSCNQVVLNGQKYCSIQVLGPKNHIIITIERPKELPVIIIKKGNTFFTNSSDKLEAIYYEKERKIEIQDKIEGLTLILENVSFNLSKEIPEIELYIIERSNNKTVVKASVIKGFNYSKAYLQLNVRGKVKQIIKDNGTSSLIWKLYRFFGGKLIIEFDEKDPIFYIENEYRIGFKNYQDKIINFIFAYNFIFPQLNTFTIITEPYPSKSVKVTLFNFLYLSLSLLGFLVYYFFFSKNK